MASIAVDLMGGLSGVESNLNACLEFAFPDDLVLVGLEETMCATDTAKQLESKGVRIVYADDFLDGSESLTVVLRKKSRSSMAICAQMLAAHEVDAVVSSGETKALMALSRAHVGTIPGLQRPAITKSFQRDSGRFHMLDLGANINCSELVLAEFARLGAAMAFLDGNFSSLKSVRVALLNIGTESGKGTSQLNGARQRIVQAGGTDFVGFAEPTDLFANFADVIVCDGFAGNIMLKTLEGVASHIRRRLNDLSQVNEGLVELGRELDPERYNGALMVGLNGIVVKSHGSTGPLGFLSALNQAKRYIDSDLTNLIRDNF
jgi:glycerol-3-phosphate acyltransferase PlsX